MFICLRCHRDFYGLVYVVVHAFRTGYSPRLEPYGYPYGSSHWCSHGGAQCVSDRCVYHHLASSPWVKNALQLHAAGVDGHF